MALVRSSDSICSLLEDNKSSIYDPTEQESDNIGLPLDSSESSKQFKLKININDPPKSTSGLMTLFNIVSPSVFDGGIQVVQPILRSCNCLLAFLLFRIGGENVLKGFHVREAISMG